MKTKLVISLAVPLLLAGVVMITPALAANGPSQPEVDKYAVTNAEASWVSFDETGCVETAVTVGGSDWKLVRKPAGSPADAFAFSGVSILILKYDYCTETWLMIAEGFADIDARSLQIRGLLNSARLTTTLTAHDELSGNSFDVFVDLTWVGIGPVDQSVEHFQFRCPNPRTSIHQIERFRSAQASGTISDGTQNYAPNASDSGLMWEAKFGSVAILRPCG